MFEINKKSEVPLYQQLVHSIKKYIEEGILKENDKIPAESEFCITYELSRTTVRQALRTLEKEGYIYKLQRGVMCLLLKFIRIGQILVSFMMT